MCRIGGSFGASEIPLFYFLASNHPTGIDRERQYLTGSLTGAVAS